MAGNFFMTIPVAVLASLLFYRNNPGRQKKSGFGEEKRYQCRTGSLGVSVPAGPIKF
jgi:hypothetical protein